MNTVLIFIDFVPFQINEAQAIRRNNQMEVTDNPLIARLDKKLQTFKVRRQTYHSRSFVGNHVAKCLKVRLIQYNF